MFTPKLEQAAAYAASRAIQGQGFKNQLSAMKFDPHDVVLDVGCGTGDLCREIAPRVKSAVGLDVSPAMVEYARRNNPHPNVDYVAADAQTFGDYGSSWREKFTKVISVYALHWCYDKEAVLKNIANSLQPGGQMLLHYTKEVGFVGYSGSYGEGGSTWLQKHEKWGKYLQDLTFSLEWPLPNEEVRPIIESVGFDITKLEELDKSLYIPLDAARGQASSVFPQLHHIPEEHHNDIINDIMDWWLRRWPLDEDGSYFVHLICGYVEAYKKAVIPDTTDLD